MRRIFLTSTVRAPFIEEDAATLRRHFRLDFFVGSGVAGFLRMFLQAARADCSICWFASVYSSAVTLSARLFRKRSVVIVGGVDAAAIPELGYGIWLSRWKSFLVRGALRRADCILVVDNSLAVALRRLSGLPLPQIRLLPTGYDAAYWQPPPPGTVRRGVLCVATCSTERRARIKGLDVLLESAALLPDLPFTVIGVDPEFNRQIPFVVPPNVRLLPPVSRQALLEHYRSTLIYCQPSRHEGLPNALCEAMLCGALPVGAGVGGVAAAIGDCGIVVEPAHPGALRNGIVRALALPPETGVRGRARIAERFTEEGRERGLIAAICGLPDNFADGLPAHLSAGENGTAIGEGEERTDAQ